MTPMLPKPSFSVAVYCGSRTGLSSAHAKVAHELGAWIGQRKGQLVYGGGSQGLMGLVAESTMTHGGTVVGVIPQNMVEREWAHHGITELVIVQSMHERKSLMIDRADAVMAMPGGIGTLDEFFEAWTWRQLGYHDKPVGLLNADGYFDGMLGFLQNSVQEDFLRPDHMQLLTLANSVEDLMPSLLGMPGP